MGGKEKENKKQLSSSLTCPEFWERNEGRKKKCEVEGGETWVFGRMMALTLVCNARYGYRGTVIGSTTGEPRDFGLLGYWYASDGTGDDGKPFQDSRSGGRKDKTDGNVDLFREFKLINELNGDSGEN